MRKLILVVLFALLAFYVAWPAWSLYRIHAALESKDAPGLAGKVDFPAVRESLRPAVLAEVHRAFEKTASKGGLGQILGGSLKEQLAPQLAEAALKNFVTADGIAELYQYRGDIRELIEKHTGKSRGQVPGAPVQGSAGGDAGKVRDALGKLGINIGGPKDAAAGSPPPQSESQTAPVAPGRPKLGLANIKSFSVLGPLGFAVGLARKPDAAAPDLTAQMSFVDFDWKLTGLVPRPR